VCVFWIVIYHTHLTTTTSYTTHSALHSQQVQEAIKLLTLAGIELTSPQAETLLRSGDIPESVILGVKKIAINLRDQAAEEAQERQLGVTSASGEQGGDKGVEEGVLQQLESFDLDAYRHR